MYAQDIIGFNVACRFLSNIILYIALAAIDGIKESSYAGDTRCAIILVNKSPTCIYQ